jgi:glycosyltransferase involved in cell wall biosynthesis
MWVDRLKHVGRQLLRAQPKIVSVNTSDLGGGAERMATAMLQGFRRRGCEAWLLVGEKKTDDPFVLPFYSSPYIDYRPYADPAFQQRLVEQKRDNALAGVVDWEFPYSHLIAELTGSAPDIVHLHNLHGGYFDLRAVVRVSQRFPTFVSLVDCWWLSGHCAYPLGCERWQTGCGECPQLDVPPEPKLRDATPHNWRQKRDVFEQCKLLVAAPSRWLLDLAKQSILAPAIQDSRVIPHGVDLSVFRPASSSQARQILQIPDDAFVVMFAAQNVRSNPFKDYATVRHAVEMVAATRPVWLLAVGQKGEDEQIGCGIVRHVPFTDSVQTMAQHYQSADVYLHAAHNEAFGIVIAEALACGLPVVATAVDGIPEVFRDGEHGFHVPHADAEAMAGAVTRLLHDPALRAALGASAAQHAREHYDADVMVDRYLDWYREALADNYFRRRSRRKKRIR